MSPTRLSRDAHQRLSDELEHLTTVGRVEIADAIEKARALGDLSENGDYHAAKDEQGKMEARIRQIQATLKDAEVVEQVNTEVVNPGSVVTIRYEGDDDTEQYLIGSQEERREGMAVASPESPLGKALLGATPGDTVSYEAPGGSLRVEVVSISA